MVVILLLKKMRTRTFLFVWKIIIEGDFVTMGFFNTKKATIKPYCHWDKTDYAGMSEVKNMRIVRVNVSGIKHIQFKDQLGNLESVTVSAVFVTDKGRLYGAGDFIVKEEHLMSLQNLLCKIADDIEKEL